MMDKFCFGDVSKIEELSKVGQRQVFQLVISPLTILLQPLNITMKAGSHYPDPSGAGVDVGGLKGFFRKEGGDDTLRKTACCMKESVPSVNLLGTELTKAGSMGGMTPIPKNVMDPGALIRAEMQKLSIRDDACSTFFSLDTSVLTGKES